MNAPRRTQDERREATRDALLGAAVALLAERGIAATTLADVAERAGVSKGALTHHFDAKDALLDAALERVGAALAAALTAAWDPTVAPFPRLRAAVAGAVGLPAAHPAELRVFAALAGEGTRDPRLGALARRHLDALEATFAQGLTFTLDELGVRPRFAPEAAARALVAAALGEALRPGDAPGELADVRKLWEGAVLAQVEL
ncbi:MAG: helix-turn-helix domain-containing protein [Polyangiales bacterium]